MAAMKDVGRTRPDPAQRATALGMSTAELFRMKIVTKVLELG
jgi:hypothetical protein